MVMLSTLIKWMPGFRELKKTSSRVCVSPAFNSICWGVLFTTWASSVAISFTR